LAERDPFAESTPEDAEARPLAGKTGGLPAFGP
jgi:hypothetical protein